MTFFILLMILAGIAATFYTTVRGGRSQLPPPTSHAVDPSFLPPASPLNRR